MDIMANTNEHSKYYDILNGKYFMKRVFKGSNVSKPVSLGVLGHVAANFAAVWRWLAAQKIQDILKGIAKIA